MDPETEDRPVFPADDKWRVVAVPPEPGSFACKRPFPAEWAVFVRTSGKAVVGEHEVDAEDAVFWGSDAATLRAEDGACFAAILGAGPKPA